MKRYATSFIAVVAMMFSLQTLGQRTASTKITKRCGTTERVQTVFRLNPSLRNIPQRLLLPTNNNYRLETISTIPVVVHIVLANPWLITDADVQGQIDRLNLDFSGLNPDSTNAGVFMQRRGHSLIRFCLAKRTPTGLLTNGIERRASSTGSNAYLETDPIKHTSSGGLDVWDPDSYLNLWIGIDVSGEGVLGYAQFPGMESPGEDGVFLSYDAFGSNACYTIPEYNKGRTGTHEVGHYFGLFHIWGDEAGCGGDDFANLSTVGSVNLPANLANAPGQGNTASDVGDTPNQGNATTNCPSGTALDICSIVSPGKMYQDYMDYTQDACYSMFTKKQVERMEWVVNNARSGLINSSGCQPPDGAITLDASPVQSVNPGGMEATGCSIVSYPSVFNCGTTFIQPKVRIKNNGLTTLTSITAGYRYNNGNAVSASFAVSIPAGGTTVITLSVLDVSTGNHTLKFFTSLPNGAVDQNPGNDTTVAEFTVSSPLTLPISEQFTIATFPPTGWTVGNPNESSITWSRWNGNAPAGVPYTSPASVWVDIFSYIDGVEHKDFLWTPTFKISNPFDSIILNFYVAHRAYLALNDTLEVVYSTDCGLSWQRLGGYYKWSGGNGSTALATVTPACICDFAPASTSQWRRERIGFAPAAIGSPASMMIGWKTSNGFGNSIYIDDIVIEAVPIIYTFIGTGNWSVSANWLNNKIPPSVLPAGHEIIINPSSGSSIRDIPVTLSAGSKLTVMPGKTLLVP